MNRSQKPYLASGASCLPCLRLTQPLKLNFSRVFPSGGALPCERRMAARRLAFSFCFRMAAMLRVHSTNEKAGDLKSVFSVSFPRSSTVYERYIRYYGWIKIQSLTWKTPFRSENVVFLLWGGGGGAGLGLKVFEKRFKRILDRLIVSAQVNVIV